jgi:hypothetical protein
MHANRDRRGWRGAIAAAALLAALCAGGLPARADPPWEHGWGWHGPHGWWRGGWGYYAPPAVVVSPPPVVVAPPPPPVVMAPPVVVPPSLNFFFGFR